MGMETGLLTFLLLAALTAAFRYVDGKGTPNLIIASICLGLANWTRTDSVVYAFPIGVYILFESFRSGRFTAGERAGEMRRIAAAAGIYLAFVVGLLAFQKLYYGEWLPNTYTLKLTGRMLLPRLVDGYVFVKPFLDAAGTMLVLALVDLAFQFSPRKLLLLVLMGACLSYEIYVGGDPWQYWRIMSPAMPLLAILTLLCLNGLAEALTRPGSHAVGPGRIAGAFAGTAIVLLSLLILRAADYGFLHELKLKRKPYTVVPNGGHVNYSLAIRDLTTADATIGMIWAGTIPYYTGRKAIEFLGKCDRYIARLPPCESGAISLGTMRSVAGHNKYDLDYSIRGLEPDFVQTLGYGSQDLRPWAEGRYVKVSWQGIVLLLKKGSPFVRWDRITESMMDGKLAEADKACP